MEHHQDTTISYLTSLLLHLVERGARCGATVYYGSRSNRRLEFVLQSSPGIETAGVVVQEAALKLQSVDMIAILNKRN